MGLTMKYHFDEESRLEDIRFDGLDGREAVTSTKQALRVMQIRNPMLDLAEAYKKGTFPDLTNDEMATIELVHNLWQYPDDPPDRVPNLEMNPLALLANAIRVIARQDVELRRYQQER